VIGSQDSVVAPQQPLEPVQQLAVSPAAARFAASPYFACTVSFNVAGVCIVSAKLSGLVMLSP
jgi:hypothetical protein